jgi:hypothetical protein
MKEWRSRPTAREAIALLSELIPQPVTALLAKPTPVRSVSSPPIQEPHLLPKSSGSGGGLATLLASGLALYGFTKLFADRGSRWDSTAQRYRGRNGQFERG